MSKITLWKEISRSSYRHSPYKKIDDVVFELPDGRQALYSLTGVGKTVAVLALTADAKIILARQFRPGPFAVLDELPGGGVDEEESFEFAAARELEEETGYVPEKLIPLGRFFESAYSTVNRHGFLAVNCQKTGVQRLDPNEFIEVVLKPLPEFVGQLCQGLCSDSEVAWAALFAMGLVKT